MMRVQQIKQIGELMSLWNVKAQFLQHRLQVLFRTLLAVEADLVM